MSREERGVFVGELAGTILREYERDSREGLIPETWDGHELRAYLALMFCRATSGVIPVEPKLSCPRTASPGRFRVREFLKAWEGLEK
jgi:hypothetical protein